MLLSVKSVQTSSGQRLQVRIEFVVSAKFQHLKRLDLMKCFQLIGSGDSLMGRCL
jgi:hypothetical protein